MRYASRFSPVNRVVQIGSKVAARQPGLRVNGREARFIRDQDIVNLLHMVPKAIKERHRSHTKISEFMNEAAARAMEAYENQQINWNFLEQREQEPVLNDFLQAARQYREHHNPDQEAHCYYMVGKAFNTRSWVFDPYMRFNRELAIPPLMKAFDFYYNKKQWDMAFEVGDLLYDTICLLIRELRNDAASRRSIVDLFEPGVVNENEAKINKYMLMLAPLSRRMVEIYRDMQGERDYGAHRVEQGQIGFSSREKMGTDSISQCGVLIIRDPKTKKTAMAHIDATTDEKSLKLLFERMPAKGLEARIFGARFADDERSRNNLLKIVRYLRKRDVNIISADIGDKNGPSTVVVDPQDFSVREAVAWIDNPNVRIGNAVHLYYTDAECAAKKKPLQMVFDFTVSPDYFPIFMDAKSVKNFLPIPSQNKDAVAVNFGLWNSCCIERSVLGYNIEGLAEAFKEQSSQLNSTLMQKIFELEQQDVFVSAEEIERATSAISLCPIYLGANASAANQRLHHIIRHDLFAVENYSAKISDEGVDKLQNAFKQRDWVKDIMAHRQGNGSALHV